MAKNVSSCLVALRANQKELAERIGVSPRTVSRWLLGRASPRSAQVAALARAVAPVDAALAARLAPGTTFARAPAGASPLALDAIVCAAADAMSAPPATARRALAAAFARAKSIGVALADVEVALAARE